jgi:TPR repeat protein
MKNVALTCLAIAVGLIGSYLAFSHAPAESSSSPQVVAKPPDMAALENAVQHGDAQSQLQMGKALVEGGANGVQPNYKKAAYWYGLASTNGSIEAMARLGELYQTGRGGVKNLSNAVALYSKSADAGNITGLVDLGFLYEKGIGVPRDQKLAAKYYRLASEEGDPIAQFDYGQRCLHGIGVDQDAIEGMKWLMIAAARGQSDSAAKLADAKREAPSQQIAEAQKRADSFVPQAEHK